MQCQYVERMRANATTGVYTDTKKAKKKGLCVSKSGASKEAQQMQEHGSLLDWEKLLRVKQVGERAYTCLDTEKASMNSEMNEEKHRIRIASLETEAWMKYGRRRLTAFLGGRMLRWLRAMMGWDRQLTSSRRGSQHMRVQSNTDCEWYD